MFSIVNIFVRPGIRNTGEPNSILGEALRYEEMGYGFDSTVPYLSIEGDALEMAEQADS